MAVAKITNNTYTVDSLYQWDKNQTLEIHGLSLPSVPEIHYTNTDMERAIVRQAAMDAAGIITAEIPNSLLQKPYKIAAYVCIYQGNTFRSLYKIEIPVNARTKPADYTFEDTDGEIYSFNALENSFANAVEELENRVTSAEKLYNTMTNYSELTVTSANKAFNASLSAEQSKDEAVEAANTVQELVPKAIEAANNAETLANETAALFEGKKFNTTDENTDNQGNDCTYTLRYATVGNFVVFNIDAVITCVTSMQQTFFHPFGLPTLSESVSAPVNCTVERYTDSDGAKVVPAWIKPGPFIFIGDNNSTNYVIEADDLYEVHVSGCYIAVSDS